MKHTLATLHPPLLGLVMSLFLASTTLVLAMISGIGANTDIWANQLLNRICLLTALVLVALPNIEATGIALQEDCRRGSPPFCLHAATMGWFFATATILILWPPPESRAVQIPIWLAAGAGFGLVMARLATGNSSQTRETTTARRRFHETERPFVASRSGRIFIYAAPIVALIATLLVLLAPVLQHSNPMYLPFLMVLFASAIGGIFPPARYRFSWVAPGLGTALMVLGLML